MKKRIFVQAGKILILALVCVSVASCSLEQKQKPADGKKTGQTGDNSGTDKKGQAVSPGLAEVLAKQSEIKKFKNYEELKEFLDNNVSADGNGSYGYGRNDVMLGDVMMEKSMDMSAPRPASDAGISYQEFKETQPREESGSSDHSTTNIQLEGVDEDDIVKNDGEYIYAVSKNNVFIVKAAPAKDAEVLAMIKFESQPQGLYLAGGKLVVYGNDTQVYNREAYKSFRRQSPFTFLKVFDITDKKNPKQVRDLDFEGSYSNSRLIGDYVYFLTSTWESMADDEIPVPRTLSDGEVIGIGCGSEKCISPDVYYIDMPYNSVNYMNVAAVNVKDADEQVSAEVYLLSANQNMYVSEKNIYLTYTKYISEYQIVMEVMREVVYPKLSQKDKDKIAKIETAENFIISPAEKQMKIAAITERFMSSLPPEEQDSLREETEKRIKEKYSSIAKEMEKTVVHKIAVDGAKLEYKAHGEVPGSVLNQFSMDEQAGFFRIATTKGRTWSEWADDGEQESFSNMYVLDASMNLVGALENLAPGEQIYSVRFMGKRAYMVTFKQTDPLFAIDLADPKNPQVLGKLKIPGFSNYLHPYDDTTLIGIGKDTEENQWGGAVTKGLKISLFDVADVANPKEAAKYTLGERDSDSLALTEHKAFLFSKEKELLSIPVTISSEDGEFGWRQTFTGAAVFTIKKDSIELRGKVEHKDRGFSLKHDWNYQYDTNVLRSLYIGDVLYTMSNKYLMMNGLADLSEIRKLELNKEKSRGDDFEIITD